MSYWLFTVVCKNSDGLIGFEWSHAGYWVGFYGGTSRGSMKFVKDCANACRESAECVGFSFRHVFSHSDCILYYYTNSFANKIEAGNDKSYIKCTGISYLLLHKETFIYYILLLILRKHIFFCCILKTFLCFANRM